MKSDVEIARARQELSQAQLELSIAKAAMNSLMNRPTNQDFTVASPVAFTEISIDRVKVQNDAKSNRPEIASAQAQTDSARHQVRAVQLLQRPDLSIQARRDSFNFKSEGGIAVVVTIPIFDWGSVKADRKRAESFARSQEKQLEVTRNRISLDVEQSARLVEATSQIVREFQGGILEKSEELAQLARTGYEKGATSYLEVLEAQRTLRSTRTAYFSSLVNHSKALVQLEWAMGNDVSFGGKPEVIK